MVRNPTREGVVGPEHLLVVPDDTEIARVRSFVTDACSRAGAERDVAHRLELAANEVCANVIEHGHPASPIEVSLIRHADETRLTISDDGAAFDPRTIPPVDVAAGIERPARGLGWHLVVHAVDVVEYERQRGRNRLTLVVGDQAGAPR